MSADPCACGCCQPAEPSAPRAVSNPPGLPAVGYRIGTYPTFREALIDALGESLPLRSLTTRDPSDYALVTLDSWAYLADILTFYSERTINEAFLRTAKLRDNVVRLASMVSYEPDPGLAATAPLAYTAQEPFKLTAGARVQSVPPAGDTSPPVKFETLADLALSPALNAVPVLAPPVTARPLDAGSTGGKLLPGGAPVPAGLIPGATLVAWSASSGEVERKRVEAVGREFPAGSVTWSPPLRASDPQNLNALGRTAHLFGYDAPTGFIESTVTASHNVQLTQRNEGPGVKTSDGQSYDPKIASTDPLRLDAEYPDVRVGDDVLIVIPATGSTSGQAFHSSITQITSVPARYGPVRATVSQVTLADPHPTIPDRHAAELLILEGEPLGLWNFDLPGQLTGDTVYAALASADAPLDGQAVVLSDASGTAYEATVVSTGPASELDGQMAIAFTPALGGPLDVTTAVLSGNLVRSSHGEKVSGELLGSGDATVAGQRFPLAKPPITYVPHPGSPHGGRSTLVVRVNGVQWTEVEYLYGAGPDDHVFVVELDPDGKYYVRFGDGVIGSRLPSGAQVTADYRTGLGATGNVGAGALHLPLTQPKGLLRVTNPVAAGGGADPETLEEARANAPNTVRTFERIVSLEDVEDQARENALVAKAHAAWITVGTELGVGLTVAGPEGAVLGADQLAELQADLDARRDPNRPLRIGGYTPVTLSIAIRLIAVEPDLRPEDVQAAAVAALLGHFAFVEREFGQPVWLSEVFVAAQSATGVLGVDVDGLTLADPAEAAAHLLSGPVNERIDLRPDELATLEASNLVVQLP